MLRLHCHVRGRCLKGAECAVIPLRNRIVGEIHAVAELLSRSGLTILREFEIEIRHVLAGTQGVAMKDVRTVRSHAEALKQCSRFFAANPHIKPITGGDTASSIRQIADEDQKQNAAIGSARGAKIYGAKVLCEDISNDIGNSTTFGLVGK